MTSKALPRWAAVFTLAALLAACGGEEQGDDSATSEATPAAAPEASAAAATEAEGGDGASLADAGKELFHGAATCFACHAQDGTGGPLAPDLTDAEWLNGDGSTEAIEGIIREGVATPQQFPSPMLPMAGMALSDDEVAALTAYVHSLSQG